MKAIKTLGALPPIPPQGLSALDPFLPHFRAAVKETRNIVYCVPAPAKRSFAQKGSRDNVPCRVWGGASRFYQPTVLLSFRLLARSCSRKTQFCTRGSNVPCRVWGSAPRFYQPSVLLSFRLLARSCSRKTQFCIRGSRDNVPCRVWGSAPRF